MIKDFLWKQEYKKRVTINNDNFCGTGFRRGVDPEQIGTARRFLAWSTMEKEKCVIMLLIVMDFIPHHTISHIPHIYISMWMNTQNDIVKVANDVPFRHDSMDYVCTYSGSPSTLCNGSGDDDCTGHDDDGT